MPERSEPFLAERVWAHPSSLTSESITTTTEFDNAGRPVRTTYSDGETETYTYDDAGRLVEIDEHKSLWATVDGFVQRWHSGGRLRIEHDDEGPVRILGPGEVVWERCDEPWPDLLRRGVDSLAERCIAAVELATAEETPEVFCLMITYVLDGELGGLTVNLGLEEDRQEALEEDDPEELPLALWSPESAEFGLLEVEPDDDLDHLLLREAALNDPREAQRTVLTEVARRLAVHEWDGLFEPTEDFVVFVSEHDEGYAAKDASVREVNPPERVAAWDDAWPPSAPREDD